MRIDKLAERVAKREGGKTNLNIAEIKEVISCLDDQLVFDTESQFHLYGLLRSLTEPEGE